ncbi:hypothetical protein AB0J63_03135 [Streptosporangium canum]|uniref:hypothetical protein n=1 Tax=Streptosporangium canum TaxID=324952 RepID=UPI00342617D6
MDPNVFVPDLIKPFWPFIAGGAFPEGKYAQISGEAVELAGLADALRRFQLESGGAVAHLLDTGAWDGAAKEEFARLFGKLVASTGGAAGQGGGGVEDPVAVLAYVEDLVRRQAAGTQQHATDIEHTQWMMIAGAVLTAAMIAKLRLFAMANPGVTPLIWSRLAFTRMENQMIKAHLLKNMGMFAGIMGGLDFGVQAGQKLAGHREEFNVGSLVWSGGTGALTGLLFGGMTFGASRLVSDDMVGVVAKDGVKNLRGLLAGAPNTVVGQAAMGGVAATAASVPMLAVNGQLDSEHLFFSVASGVLGGIGPTAVHPDAVTGGSGVPDGGSGGGFGDRSGGGSGDKSGDRSGGGSGDRSGDGFGGGLGDGARPGGAPEGRGPTPPPEGASPSPSPDRTSLAARLDGGASGDHGVASGDGSGGGGSNGRVVADRGDGVVPARAADGVLPVQAGVEGTGRAGERVAPGGADGTRPARPAEGDAPAAARARADGPATEGGPVLRAVEDHGGPAAPRATDSRSNQAADNHGGQAAPRAAADQGGQAVPHAAAGQDRPAVPHATADQGGPAVPGAGHDGGPVPSRPGSDAAPAVREGEAAQQAPASERQTATASDSGAPVRVAGDGIDSVTGAPVTGRARQDGSAELPAGAEADQRGPASSSAAPGRRDGQPARPGAEEGAGGTTASHPGGGDGRTPAAPRIDPKVTAGREIAETVRVPEDGHSIVAKAPTTPPRTEPARPDTPPGDPSFNKVQEHLPPSSTRRAPAQPSGNVRSAADGSHTADQPPTPSAHNAREADPVLRKGEELARVLRLGQLSEHDTRILGQLGDFAGPNILPAHGRNTIMPFRSPLSDFISEVGGQHVLDAFKAALDQGLDPTTQISEHALVDAMRQTMDADPHHTETHGEQALINPPAAEGAGPSADTAQGSTADHLPAAPLERHIPLPRPEDLQLERGADGLIERVNGSSVHDFVGDMTRSRGLEYRTRRQEQTDLAFSDQKAGPVLSVLMDRKTGRLYEGVNDMIVVPDDLHPLLRERFDRLTDWSEEVGPFDHGSDYPPGASPHFSEPGTHAEVTAVNKALFDRTARGETVTPATLQELYFDNRWIRVVDDLERAPCCANCTHFLYDVPNPAGYYSRYPHDGVTVETFTPPYI